MILIEILFIRFVLLIKLYDLWIYVKSEKVVCCILKKMIYVICMCINLNLKKKFYLMGYVIYEYLK